MAAPEAEDMVRVLEQKMTPAQHKVYDDMLHPPVAIAKVPLKQANLPAPKPGAKPRAESKPDPQKQGRDLLRIKALRAAYGGQVPLEVLHAAFGENMSQELLHAFRD